MTPAVGHGSVVACLSMLAVANPLPALTSRDPAVQLGLARVGAATKMRLEGGMLALLARSTSSQVKLRSTPSHECNIKLAHMHEHTLTLVRPVCDNNIKSRRKDPNNVSSGNKSQETPFINVRTRDAGGGRVSIMHQAVRILHTQTPLQAVQTSLLQRPRAGAPNSVGLPSPEASPLLCVCAPAFVCVLYVVIINGVGHVAETLMWPILHGTRITRL